MKQCVRAEKNRVKPTARLFGLGKQALLKRPLLLQVLQALVEIGFS
jgi:hypothetical protein